MPLRGLFCLSGKSFNDKDPVDMFPHTAHIETVALLVAGE